MKKILLAVLVMIVLPAVCWADFNSANWQYFKNIQPAGGGLVKITLDDEIFSGSKNNLRDLRVIDSNNAEVPFKVISGKQDEIKTIYDGQLINNSFVSGRFSTAILDLGERGRITNNLRVNTPSENFQRNAKIYGSDDMLSWNILQDNAYIYDYTDKKGNFKSQDTTISFPESVFRYLKIEIADDNGNPVRITSVAANQSVNAVKREFERRPIFSTAENIQNKSTELIVDLGSSGIPANKFRLQAQGENFNRAVMVFASNDKSKWDFVGQGYVFRYTTAKFSGENMAVNFPETNDRYLKIEIINKDDQSLAIRDLTVFSVYRDVIFQAERGRSYKIFYGNPKAGYPEYDLDKYFQYLDAAGAQTATLSPQSENAGFIAEKEPIKPLSERVPYLFSIVLVLVSLGLLLLVYKFFKKKD